MTQRQTQIGLIGFRLCFTDALKIWTRIPGIDRIQLERQWLFVEG